MKNSIIFLMLSWFSVMSLYAQDDYQAPALDNDENYTYTKVYQKTGTPESNADVLESVTYFDGLGRPKQQIAIKASPYQKDLVTHIEYDDFGRQTKTYLPFKSDNTNVGSYRNPNSLKTDTKQFYKTKYPTDFSQTTTSEINPYSEQILEASPMGRVLETAAPGDDWKIGSDHTIKFDYAFNTSSDNVIRFDVSLNSDRVPSLVKNGVYSVNTLYKNTTKDENWTTSDGDTHTVKEFTDLQGRVILTRTFNEVDGTIEPHDTYYVYDNFGNLTYVIPPAVNASTTISTGILNKFCYQYHYDYRNRMIEKKIPGKGIEYIVYNALDQPILAKQSDQPWVYTKYDVFGRVAYTGLWNTTETIANIRVDAKDTSNPMFEESLVSSISIDNIAVNYSNNAYPNTNSIELHTVNYYDSYNFETTAHTTPTTVFEQAVATGTKIKSLSTGTMVRVLDTNDWIYTITYYDLKARPIYIYSKNNFLKTVDIVKTKYDYFNGRVLKTRHEHTKDANPTVVTQDVFRYDHIGRLIDQHQCIGDNTLNENCGNLIPSPHEDNETRNTTITSTEHIQANHQIRLTNGFHFKAASGKTLRASIFNQGETGELITHNTYDELGQLESKKVGNTIVQPLQTIDFSYNVRGWSKGINDPSNLENDLFAFKINYNTTDLSGSTPLFNGNISETHWKTKNDNVLRNYKYQFDKLNRITGALGGINNRYDLSSVAYDKMGNITSLERRGAINDDANAFGVMDKLLYVYNGNQLRKVTEANDGNALFGFKDGNTSGDDYTYDNNGNMAEDKNKEISNITYNHLNLPNRIILEPNDQHSQREIEYTYDALGNKMKKYAWVKSHTSTTKITIVNKEYAGNFTYTTPWTSGTGLEYIQQAEGYLKPKNITNLDEGFQYVYQYKDHLGNIRLSYSDDNDDGQVDANEIWEEKNYYPFGLQHKGYNSTVLNAHPYGYNGIEEENELGVDFLSMDVRKYDPAIARWTGIDPVTHYNLSPYNAFDNNPVFWADPSGANSDTLFWENDRKSRQAWDTNKNVGADGLTTRQWMDITRPGSGGDKQAAIRSQRQANKMGAFERSRERRKSFEFGKLQGDFEKAGFPPPPLPTFAVSSELLALESISLTPMTPGLDGNLGLPTDKEWLSYIKQLGSILSFPSRLFHLDPEAITQVKEISDTVHANSKRSQRPNIVYELYSLNLETFEYQTLKYGVSSRADFIRRSGNPRPEYQAIALNAKLAGTGLIVSYSILNRTPDRLSALTLESNYVKSYQLTHNGAKPPLQKRP